MPFCIDCGVRVAEGAQRCPNCLGQTAKPAACLNCGQPYTSAQAKFCMRCGAQRPEPTGPPAQPPTAPAPPTTPAPAPQPSPQPPPTITPAAPTTTTPGGIICAKCGRENKVATAKFCIYCAEPLPNTQTPAKAPPAQGSPPEPPPKPKVMPLNPDQQKQVETMSQARLGIYQKTGRLVLAACRTGAIPREQLPPDLAKEIDSAFAALQGGHTRLIKSGICPQCQDVGLDPSFGKCAKCGLTVSRDKEGDK